jgi:hypothetical protein
MKDLINTVINANVEENFESIKKYCKTDNSNDIDREKFKEVMNLGKKTDDKKRDTSAIRIAAKNGHVKLVEFIIQSALTDEEYKQLLKLHLCEFFDNKQSVLHDAANTPDNEIIIEYLCKAAKQLGIENYPNLLDGMHGNTALHIAARAGSASNYFKLIECGANPAIKATNGILPSEAVKYATTLASGTKFLKAWMTSEEGKKYFQINYPGFEFSQNLNPKGEIPDEKKVLFAETIDYMTGQIIALDFDLRSTDSPPAQLSALEKLFTFSQEVTGFIYLGILNPKQYEALLVHILWKINFSIITKQDLRNDESDVEKKLKGILTNADSIQLRKEATEKIEETIDEVKVKYIRAEMLRQLNFPAAHEKAFNEFGSEKLYKNCTDLVLCALRNLRDKPVGKPLDSQTLAIRFVLAHIHQKIKELSQRPIFKVSFFSSILKPRPIPNNIPEILQFEKKLNENDSNFVL